MTKLCVGASSGGHMAELDALLANSQDWPVQPSLYIATVAQVSNDTRKRRQYVIGECNRSTLASAMAVFVRSLKIVWREKPDVIVTTGSLPLALFALAGRLFGAQIVWIDSISQVDELSLSGRLIKPFTRLFFVQWPELTEKYPNTCYAGELV